MKQAVMYDIYDKDGNMVRIEVTDNEGNHLFDALWDSNDEQTSDNRIAHRQFTKTMIKRKGYTVAE